ncbi:peroxiredoxin [Bacillus toyonensis]|uniref:thioredoxin-dependent peroxiredoxin n=1 Tax=Bacillus toyonensis TaxID=155322 RepID=A0AB73R3Y7_9BACI|nr:peroxiredoxin [Bacillus toyonensis]OTX04669.1 thioredoxin-dependent thiol peroxidase [Bacillus thuringiensis serovar seoulensis]MED3201921.1 peroxiredoxin [Bacillus toyonensis]PEI86552.1 thioredoxin-dependent thiol peroxidase [Bacillus toyonensis]PEL51500.1 thioredoxin-dependent thiol peroxidase [Bacillus toyonensis]PEM45245.1 thioredoxin-dependent thiol peroxidase [Bacillus toyonensis]
MILENRILDFKLLTSNGKELRLNDYLGKYIVLFFYPKNGTPGCTKEACSFRDNYSEFQQLEDVELFGISADNLESHQKFSEDYQLPFQLLSDENFEVAKRYGVYEEKKFLNKAMKSINRTTFILDKKGIIQKIFTDVNPSDHAKEVLEELKKIRK